MTDTQTSVGMIRRPPLWYLTTAASIAVGVIPIWILESWFLVPRKIIVGYGFLAYIIGVTAIKLPLHHFIVERILRPRLSAAILAASQGVLSGVSELGAAAAFFVFVIPRLSWWQLVGFGVGAGAVEAIMLPFISNPFKGTTLEEHADRVFREAAADRSIQWLSVLERVWAMLLQVSTRGLVYFSVADRTLIPACVALAGFAIVDGTAYYWHLKKVRFDSVRVLARVHAYLAFMAVVLVCAFLLWSRSFSFPVG